MAVFNIIDGRSNEKENFCDAVFEVDHNDWQSIGLRKPTPNLTEWIGKCSVYDVMYKAMCFKGLVTVYLYDQGQVPKMHNLLTYIHPQIKDQSLNQSEIDKNLLTSF